MSKPHKLVSSKKVSGLGGVYDVTFGNATVERRQQRDFSKDGISAVDNDLYDDHKERRERWNKSLFKL